MIKIMADSTCDLSPEVLAQYNIGVAPLNITINGVSYQDKIDLTADAFFWTITKIERATNYRDA